MLFPMRISRSWVDWIWMSSTGSMAGQPSLCLGRAKLLQCTLLCLLFLHSLWDPWIFPFCSICLVLFCTIPVWSRHHFHRCTRPFTNIALKLRGLSTMAFASNLVWTSFHLFIHTVLQTCLSFFLLVMDAFTCFGRTYPTPAWSCFHIISFVHELSTSLLNPVKLV